MATQQKKTHPYPLWVVAGFNLAIAVKLYFTGEAHSISLLFAVLATPLIFFRSKLTWTVSLSWLAMALALSFVHFRKTHVELESETLVLMAIHAINTFAQFVVTMLYFKYPYVEARSSMLGFNPRIDTKLPASIEVNGKSIDAVVTNLSKTGAAIDFPAGEALEGRLMLKIPSLNDFSSWVRVVRKENASAALEFTGMSPRSVVEHTKVIRWIHTNVARPASENGFTLIEALLVCGVGSMAVFGATTLVTEMTKANQASTLSYELISLRDEFLQTMRNQKSWQNMIENNAALECVRKDEDCTGKQGPVDIYDQNATVRLHTLTPTAGFTAQGVPCNAFDGVNGNDQCPIRFTVTSIPICLADACENPVIELRLRLQYVPKTRVHALNTAKLDASIFRDPLVDSLEKNCTSAGGTFNSADGSCNLNMLSSVCASNGQYLAGLKGNEPVCRSFSQTEFCSGGQYLQGFNSSGNAICISM